MTRSPDLVVAMNGFVRRYCSAINGEIFALNPPVPEPVTTSDNMNNPVDAFPPIMPGMAEMIMMTCPSMARATLQQTVL